MTVSEINGKKAITNYKTIKVFNIKNIPRISLIECELETGRTHQIRVHMKYKGASLLALEGALSSGVGSIQSILPKNISVYAIAKNLELYTTAESCSMCMSAIAWSGFGRVIYGTSIPYIESQGQNQIEIRSVEVAKASSKFSNVTVIGGVLVDETNELYNKKNVKHLHHHVPHHHHHDHSHHH